MNTQCNKLVSIVICILEHHRVLPTTWHGSELFTVKLVLELDTLYYSLKNITIETDNTISFESE